MVLIHCFTRFWPLKALGLLPQERMLTQRGDTELQVLPIPGTPPSWDLDTSRNRKLITFKAPDICGAQRGKPGGGRGGRLQGGAEVGGDKGRAFPEEEAQEQRVTEGKAGPTGR